MSRSVLDDSLPRLALSLLFSPAGPLLLVQGVVTAVDSTVPPRTGSGALAGPSASATEATSAAAQGAVATAAAAAAPPDAIDVVVMPHTDGDAAQPQAGSASAPGAGGETCSAPCLLNHVRSYTCLTAVTVSEGCRSPADPSCRSQHRCNSMQLGHRGDQGPILRWGWFCLSIFLSHALSDFDH